MSFATKLKSLRIRDGRSLQQVADAIIRQAHRQGFVVTRDIRTELKLAGLPEEQWKDVATLDSSVTGAWASVGRDQLEWLNRTLSSWGKDRPLVIFSHNPLYEYYPPWNFWVRDWREVHEVLEPYRNVTNIHGHTHQVLYNEIGTMRSIGMLATSWPWPYAPQGVPALTKPMVRVDPGDPYDGVGWGRLTASRSKLVCGKNG